MYDDNKTEKFWTFISRRMNAEAALADWRLKLGDALDFDKLHRRYLAPTGKMAEVITCPDQCDPSCGFRKVCEWEGKYEAVCRERMRKDYAIEKADALFFTIKPSGLLPEIVKIFKIIPHIEEFGNEEDTWKLGVVPMPGGKSATVYITLKIWSYTVMDLIFQLNCAERQPYILLVTDRTVINETCDRILKEMGSVFVPLNEVLDFNAQTELELIRECNLAQLVTPSTPETEPEPENIFRKCGDAWEVRFRGGEKLMLMGAETGAQYIHYLLQRPNQGIPAVNIVRKISGESCLPEDFEDMADGFSVNSLPAGNTGKVADIPAVRQYREEERKLVREIENAEDSGDNVLLAQLQNDLKIIRTAINQAVSPSGQHKLLGDPELRVTNSFRNSVNYAIDRIDRYDERFASHLRKAIKCGRVPEYASGCEIDWTL
ncbi:MAG: hypothetical protein WCS27_14350 [Victivallaceae bacterium]